MPKSVYSIIPDPEAVLHLEPEELGAVMLESLNSVENLGLSKHNYGLHYTVQEYPEQYHDRLLKALMVAWGYLEREGFIAEEPANKGWYFITDRGREIKHAKDLAAYRIASLLPTNILHPIIANKVESSFLRGEYDTAVFIALKEVEVVVRSAGGFAPTDIGVPLMRKAFDKNDGPLTDATSVEAERQALSDLFAGAIGAYKNPHSHRNMPLDAAEAVEIITLASHLLKIAESRAKP